jgi:hypothetical protein
MTKLEAIEKAVLDLSAEELERFRSWFEEFAAERFDATIARDLESGRLDFLLREAAEEHRAGRTRKL